MASIKYTKNILWLRPFVEISNSLVPLKKIKSIVGYKVRKGLTETAYGALYKYEHERKFRMSIRVYQYGKKENSKKKIYQKMRCETILLTLAHELAHVVHWEHTPEHFKLQGQLMMEFYKILKKNKIKDHMTRNPDKILGEDNV